MYLYCLLLSTSKCKSTRSRSAELTHHFGASGSSENLFICSSTCRKAEHAEQRNVSFIKQDASFIKWDASSIKWDVSSIKWDTSSIKWDVSSIKQDASSIKQDASFIKWDASFIKWDAY